jgi:DNA-binding PadR family transcriptional regulator
MMDQLTIARAKISRLTKREQLVVLEIAGDPIDSASAFVSYISESYGFSKSSVWYNLNRLKEKGVLDFATRDEPGKTLTLTKQGGQELHILAKAGVKLDEIEMQAPNDPTIPPAGDVLRKGLSSTGIVVHAFGR